MADGEGSSGLKVERIKRKGKEDGKIREEGKMRELAQFFVI